MPLHDQHVQKGRSMQNPVCHMQPDSSSLAKMRTPMALWLLYVYQQHSNNNMHGRECMHTLPQGRTEVCPCTAVWTPGEGTHVAQHHY